ncbi:MAG: class I SAM-dependent rRNA methyltransferase, partial [Planctomycetota bacterium]
RMEGRDQQPPDSAYFTERVNEAAELRERIIKNDSTDVYRLVNAEGDGIPGLVIERYGDFGVAWRMTPGLAAITPMVYPSVMKRFHLKGLYEKGPPREGYHPGMGEADAPVMGEAAPEPLVVREEGMRLNARLAEGPRTGVYPDQRDNRRRLAPMMPGIRVLNTFSYTGAFSVSAALAGAAETVSVDLSQRSLEWSRQNFDVNRIDPGPHLHVKADVFDYLNLAQRRGFSFHLIILDPPTFSTSKKGMFRARKDWPRLLGGALPLLESNGRLAVSCNTRELTEPEMGRFLRTLSKETGRAMEMEEVSGLPLDFPTHPHLPAMDYLKFILVRFH